MKWIEQIKWQLRANKYKNKDDKGGIAYIESAIKKGDIVFDIGAHKGGYLFFMLQQVGVNGKIFAFEPQHTLFNYLIKLKQLFKLNNVTIENMALSNENKEVTLFIPGNKVSNHTSPGATIVANKEASAYEATQQIQANTLDNYCSHAALKPNFLKIDVEGNELQVLMGGEQTIKQYKPKILVEIEARHIGEENVLKTFNYLQNLGYKGKFIHGLVFKDLSEFSFLIHQKTTDKLNYCNNFIFE